MTQHTEIQRKAAMAIFGGILAAAPSVVAAQSTTIHSLTVRRDTSTSYSNAQADAAFNLATDGTTTDDGSYDISCDHGFVRNGSVTTFSNPSGWDCTSINSAAELTACFARPGFIKIVGQLNYCGGSGSFIGCAYTPGNTILLEDSAAKGWSAGALVNHEFGHATGLGHRSGTNYIMNPSINGNYRKLNSTECTSLKKNNMDQNGPGNGASAGGVIAPEAGELIDFSGTPIEDLARTYFMDSMPMEVADFYGRQDIKKLKKMLKDPANAEYYRTIVALIGMISDGTEGDAEALIDFVRGRKGHDAHKSSALISLGYAANRGSERALSFLETKVDEADEAAEAAMLGLGVSGKARAQKKLRQLRKGAKGPRAATLDGALSESDDVVKRGLRGHYGR